MKVLDEWCPVPQDNSKFQDEHIREVSLENILDLFFRKCVSFFEFDCLLSRRRQSRKSRRRSHNPSSAGLQLASEPYIFAAQSRGRSPDGCTNHLHIHLD